MYPVYRPMEPYPRSHPHNWEPNPYHYHHYPHMEANFPHMGSASSKPPAFESWPHNSTSSHPIPTGMHSCCSQSYPPGYYEFRPPYSHMQTPPHVYYHGPYPPYLDAYPTYFVPPPQCTVDQLRYEPDKAKDHCCGCPNHTCYRNGSSLKIEEQNHESEPNKNDSSSLIRWPNYPHSVAWINPPKDKETDKNYGPHSGLWNGWVPLDKKHQHGEDKAMQRSWPIIWMPGYEKPADSVKDLKEVNAGANAAEEFPSRFKIIPLKLLEDEKRGEKPGVVEDVPRNHAHSDSAIEEEIKTRTVPVKLADEQNEKRFHILEKQKDKGDENKLILPESQDNGVKKAFDSKQTLPKKSSKLPPVCLRVDPLPKKKSVDGTSQCPSPPDYKQDRAHKAPAIHERKEEILKKEIRVVGVDDKSPKQIDVPVSKITSGHGPVDKAKEEIEKKGSISEEGEEMKERRRVLSESDAALIIQSAYRGWEVRRWQPLEKLGKISQIREQAADVKGQVESLEASSKQQGKKQRILLLSESIMNLLLQLDAVQGLHPSVREIRKSVARDLTCLQEKLDCLANVEEGPFEKSSNDESLGVAFSEAEEESVSDQKEHEKVSPENGQALEVVSEHSIEPSPLMETEVLPPDAETEPREKVIPELENPSEISQEVGISQEEKFAVPSSEEVINLEEATILVKDEGPEPTADTEELLEHSTGEDKSGFGGKTNLLQNDNQQEELQVPSSMELLESGEEKAKDFELEEDASEAIDDSAPPAIVLAMDTPVALEEEDSPETAPVGASTMELINGEKKMVEENEKLRVMLEKSGFGGKTNLLQNEKANNQQEVQVPSSMELLESGEEKAKNFELEEDASEAIDDSAPPIVLAMDTPVASEEDDFPEMALVGASTMELINGEKKMVEENEKLRLMLEKLLEVGNQQLGVISDLNGRVKELEKKLMQKKRARVRRSKLHRANKL